MTLSIRVYFHESVFEDFLGIEEDSYSVRKDFDWLEKKDTYVRAHSLFKQFNPRDFHFPLDDLRGICFLQISEPTVHLRDQKLREDPRLIGYEDEIVFVTAIHRFTKSPGGEPELGFYSLENRAHAFVGWDHTRKEFNVKVEGGDYKEVGKLLMQIYLGEIIPLNHPPTRDDDSESETEGDNKIA